MYCHLKETVTHGTTVPSGLLCNFVTVYIDFCAICFTTKTKTLYTIVHLLLEKLNKVSLKLSLSTQSLCHTTISPGVGVHF